MSGMLSSIISGATKPKSVPKGPEDLYMAPLHLKVNGIKLKYRTGFGWVSESNDISDAADALESALDQTDILELENDDLRAELSESSDLRNIAMAMLMEEKTKNVALEKEIESYKAELKKAYAALNAQDKLRSVNVVNKMKSFKRPKE
jgi:hypothetical protein